MSSIKDKVALITGGAGGLGLSMVENLLQNEAKGIAIVDLSEESGQTALDKFEDYKEKVIFIKTDVTSKKELQDAFETTVKTFNQLDIVINNAGIVNEAEWEKTIAVNLVAVIQGTYLALKEYLPKYKSGEEGIVVNTASIMGFETAQCTPVYCTTKHGLIGLGKALGGKDIYEKYKVRILTMCPGVVLTPLSQKPNKLFMPEIAKAEVSVFSGTEQIPEFVGEALIEIIEKGKNGSLWVTEESKPVYEVVFPHHKTLKAEKK